MKHTLFYILAFSLLVVLCLSALPPTTAEKREKPKLLSVIDKVHKNQNKIDLEEGEFMQDEALGAEGPSSIVVERLPEDVDTNAYEFTTMCQLKQGFITLLNSKFQGSTEKDIKKGDISVQKYPYNNILHGQQVFAVLNEDTLSLFENQNANSLIRTINVRSIDPPNVVRLWQRYNCFQLVPRTEELKEKKEILEHGLHIELPREDDMLTLCTSNLKAMQDWTSALYLFEICQVEGPEDKDDGISGKPHSLITRKSKQKKKYQSTTSVKYRYYKEEKSGMWYKQVITTNHEKTTITKHSEVREEQNMIKRLKQKQTEYERLQMDSKLTEIQKSEFKQIQLQIDQLSMYIMSINKEQSEEEKLEIMRQRDYILQMDRLKRQQQCDEEKQRVQLKRKKYALFDKYAEIAGKKDKSAYEKAFEQIKLEKEKEIQKIKDTFEQQQQQVQDNIEAQKKKLVASAAKAAQINDHSECNNIVLPTNVEAFQTQCNKWAETGVADAQTLNECISNQDKPTLCNMCCSSLIGSDHETQQATCIEECTTVKEEPTESRRNRRRRYLKRK